MNNYNYSDPSDKQVGNNGFDKDDNYRGKEGRPFSNSNILVLLDNFIEQIQSIRRTILGVSLFSLILAPFAIGLSIYLLTHASFFKVLEMENEFGIILSILLIAVIAVSIIWLFAGVWQYKKLGSWNKRYSEYMKEKQEMDEQIANQLDLDI